MLNKKQLKIISQTRKWAMRNRHKYNVSSDLSCMCAIASAKLFKNLKKININSTLTLSDYHCWIELKDIIIDITASQFCETPILIMEKNLYYKILKEKDYLEEEIFHYNNYKIFLKHMKLWPKTQRPDF